MKTKKILESWTKKDIVRTFCQMLPLLQKITENQARSVEQIGSLASLFNQQIDMNKDFAESLYSLEKRITKLERKRGK